MSLPEAAIEAAIEAVSRYPMDDTKAGRAAIEAAESTFREAIVQEIEDSIDAAPEVFSLCSDWIDGVKHAARIVRGGTP